MDWSDMLPSRLASSQKAWERAHRLKWAYEHTRVSYRELGEHSGLGRERVRQLVCYAYRHPVSPLSIWLKAAARSLPFEMMRMMERQAKRQAALDRAKRFNEAGMLGTRGTADRSML